MFYLKKVSELTLTRLLYLLLVSHLYTRLIFLLVFILGPLNYVMVGEGGRFERKHPILRLNHLVAREHVNRSCHSLLKYFGSIISKFDLRYGEAQVLLKFAG